MSESPEQELRPGYRVLDRYTVVGKLAQGGMAEVYLCKQQGPAGYQKLVVVKRVRPQLANDKDFVAMFVNEARLAALINHPNVVQIFDLGQTGKDWFLAMEFLDGRDMLQVGRACRGLNKAVPFDVTARIIADACAGLDHAHRLVGADGKPLNLVHRDMSPENVLITFEGSVKVVDFGIAKASDNAFRTQAGQIKGKLGYVAPEAILGRQLDGRADIFAIGATLYLFLCGRPAFTGANPMEIFEKSLKPPDPPSQINNRIPPLLEQICMKCLEQDPNQRYRTTGELRQALEGYLQSTGRPLGGPQLAQFMRILFPPDKDPVRQRIDGLLRESLEREQREAQTVASTPNYSDDDATHVAAPVPLPPSSFDTAVGRPVSVASTQAPPSMSDVEATAIVPPSEATHRAGAPAAVDLPRAQDPASGAYHLRSVELAEQLEKPPAKRSEAPTVPPPTRTAAPPAARRHNPDLTVEIDQDLLDELSEQGLSEPDGPAFDDIDDADDIDIDLSDMTGTTPGPRVEAPEVGSPPPVVDDDFRQDSFVDLAPPVAAPPHVGPPDVGPHDATLLDSEPPAHMSIDRAETDPARRAPPVKRGPSVAAKLLMLVLGALVGSTLVLGGLHAAGELAPVAKRFGVELPEL